MSKSTPFDLLDFVKSRTRPYDLRYDADADTVHLSGSFRTADLLDIASTVIVGQQIAARYVTEEPAQADDPAFSDEAFNDAGFTADGRSRFLDYYGDGKRVSAADREEALKKLKPLSAPIYNLFAPDLAKAPGDSLRKKFHAVGTKCFKDRWDEVRPRIVTAVSKGRAESSSDLCEEEMKAITVAMEIEIIHRTLI
jgi:hypothetical protein